MAVDSAQRGFATLAIHAGQEADPATGVQDEPGSRLQRAARY